MLYKADAANNREANVVLHFLERRTPQSGPIKRMKLLMGRLHFAKATVVLYFRERRTTESGSIKRTDLLSEVLFDISTFLLN